MGWAIPPTLVLKYLQTLLWACLVELHLILILFGS